MIVTTSFWASMPPLRAARRIGPLSDRALTTPPDIVHTRHVGIANRMDGSGAASS